MSCNNTIPSLTNPPKAPKKKAKRLHDRRRLEKIPKLRLPDPEPKPEWRVLAESGRVREKFLTYSPEDVKEIDDIDFLTELRGYYTPYSQPRNPIEAAYLDLVVEAIDCQLYLM